MDHTSLSYTRKSITSPKDGATTSQSTGADVNPLKFGGKELTTLFGRHEYDFSARMYAPLSGRFSSPDRKAWDYPWLSPYCFCAADPINYIDPTGMDWLFANFGDDIFLFYHPDIKSAKDINKYFENHTAIKYIGKKVGFHFKNNEEDLAIDGILHEDGSFEIEGWEGDEQTEYDAHGLHVGNHKTTDISKINKNRYGSYLGEKNPKSADGKRDSYAVPPADYLDYAAFQHDKDYDEIGASGAIGILVDTRVFEADRRLQARALKVCMNSVNGKQLRWAIQTIILLQHVLSEKATIITNHLCLRHLCY